MITIKEFKLSQNKDWFEVTWIEDETIVHCESFSGHPEHIQMLKIRALEFDTPIDKYQDIIDEAVKNFIVPTQEALDKYVIDNQIAEYKNYLSSTDYKMTIDYFATLDKVTQDELISKRAEAREFIRNNTISEVI